MSKTEKAVTHEDISLVGRADLVRRRGARRVYNWDTLEVGQSLFVPYDESAPTTPQMVKRLRNAVSWAKRQGHLDPEVEVVYAEHTRRGTDGLLAGRVA